MFGLAIGPRSLRESLALVAILTMLVLLSLTIAVPSAYAGEVADECIDEASLSHEELRDMLRAAGSNVADPQNASGSDATSWNATIVVPEELCEATVTFSSYVFPSGFIQPYEDQELFDSVTATYAPGTHTVTVDVAHPCGWQADLYVGPVLSELLPGVGHPGERQIDVSANETGEPCIGTGSLTVVKDAINGDGSFAFSVNGGASFNLADGGMSAHPDLAPGDYVLTETMSASQTAAGWSLTSITCDPAAEGMVNLAAGTVTVHIDEGDSVSCTFVNTMASAQTTVTPPVTTVTPPMQGTLGSSGGPRAPLPNTATDPPGTSNSPAGLLALVVLASLCGLAYANARTVRQPS